jgi:hypothetical protein
LLLRRKIFILLIFLLSSLATAIFIILSLTIFKIKKDEIADFHALTIEAYSALPGIEKSIDSVGYIQLIRVDEAGKMSGASNYNNQLISEYFSKDSILKINSLKLKRNFLDLKDRKSISYFATIENNQSSLILLLTPKSVLYRYFVYMIFPLLIIFLIFLAIGFWISSFMSKKLSEDIEKLINVFSNLKLESKNDLLISNFSSEFQPILVKTHDLVNRVQNYIKEQKKSAYLESQIELAKSVQLGLFPHLPFETSKIKVRSNLIPAESCSGDWFYYELNDNKLVCVIGDVTGHGVSSAILASVCRGVWQKIKKSNPTEMLYDFDSTIKSLGYKDLYMTMLAVVIDLETMMLSYASASHEAPILLSPKNGTQFLISPLCPRLGDLSQKNLYDYKTESIGIEKGDKVLLFTDGIFEIKINNKALTDTNLAKILKSESTNSWTRFFDGQIQNKKYSDDISLIEIEIP